MKFIERSINNQVLTHLIAQSLPTWQAELLARRLNNPAEADKLLEAALSKLTNPNQLPDMTKAVELLAQAIGQQKRIVCVVDYDTDGISSGAILQEGLSALGANVMVMVTNRHEDGYGFSAGACDKLLALNPLPDVLITADLGSSDGTQIERLQRLVVERSRNGNQTHQIQVIVTDHHHISATTPPKTADAFINPHRIDVEHGYHHPVCGAMVAWNLVAALRGHLKSDYDVRQLLDLAAIATVGDMVNLSDPVNRAVVKQGLTLINRRQRPAWQLLAEQLNTEAPMREDTIGFQISPRINALSRMGDDGHTALKWLTTHDMRVAQQSWVIMNQNNDDRKDEQALCERLALEQAQQQLADNRFIIICHVPEASHGVVGLAAGRIAMTTGRPAIVFSDTDKEQLTGSARSILGYDIRDLLERTQILTGLISKYGGHAAAAGLTLNNHNDLTPFAQALNQLIEIDFAGQHPEAQIYHDGELPIELLRPNGLRQLDKLSPFGQGFAQPSFMIQAPVNSSKTMGKNEQHLRLSLSVNNEALEAVWFNAAQIPRVGENHCFVITLGENHFRGKVTMQAMILACE